MTAQQTMSKPPVVVVASLEPVPVEGCDICGALAVQREAAREVADMAKVKSCNDEITSHPHPKKRADA